tara:strand:- start:6231 stop:8792 length:2562 start_codon:yes stop_codon:yes gene_type:complete
MALTYNALEKRWINVPERSDNKTDYKTDADTGAAARYQGAIDSYINGGGKDGNLLRQFITTKNNLSQQDRNNEAANAAAAELNRANEERNASSAKKNSVYDKVIAIASTAQKGDYLSQRETIRNLDIDENTRKDLETSYRQFYVNEKLDKWDPALTSKPPYGDFNPNYYKDKYPDVADAWKRYVANDDVDVVERYGENGFYANHYTNTGKKEQRRANTAETAEEANRYKELKKTDAEIQDIRDKQLNFNTGADTTKKPKTKTLSAEYGNSKEIFGRVDYEEAVAAGYSDSEIKTWVTATKTPLGPDIEAKLKSQKPTSSLEDAINILVGEKEFEETKKFGALRQDVLKQAIAEMKKAKGKEQMLSVLGGFSGFNEIMDINKELSNSIMGDSGVGGILSQMGNGGKAEDALEKKLQGITGVRNNATYNWQQWFDKTLKTRYQQDLELGYKAGDAEEKLKIEGDFARNFVDTYLNPRFNTSRSMDEFVEYIDVRQEEQNPFQTQDRLSALKMTADLRTEAYLNTIKTAEERSFNADFYFNPTGDEARADAYKDQASTVTQDWDAAKKGDPYWAQQAYRFGIDINNKQDFARIHFQVKGQGKGYDGADDIVNASKVKDAIYNTILPALKLESDKQGSVFGVFTTPEEFADEMLKGLNPEDKTSWEEVLKRFGLTNFKGTLDELKQYLQETLRTGSAQTIRENIKYLNDKRKEPTQQNLGLTYIQRAEDYKNKTPVADTELFKTFQSSGYQGSEDDFYKDFFPDLDRSEQALLTKSGKNDPLKSSGLDLSDPFAALGTIESFLGGDEEPDKVEKEEEAEPSSNFFRIGLGDEEEDEDYKSKTGSQILGEFTSMFKGL